MTADIVAAVLLLALTAYAILGGADFGGGLWDLLAGSSHHGARPRERIDRSIGPVWEANHVWLIIVLVLLWTAFPTTFAAVFTTLFVPLSLAVLGIVARGAGFAFRKQVRRMRLQALTGGIFALSSLLTPFFLGTAIGALVTGRVTGTGDRLPVWTSPTAVLTGTLFVACAAYLAAAFLAVDATRDQQPQLRRYFTRRAVAAGVVTAGLAALTMAVLHGSAPILFTHLTGGRALPLVAVSVLAGTAVLGFLLRGIVGPVRPLAVVAVTAVVWGWALAQYPYLLPPTLTIAAAAAPPGTLIAELVVAAAIAVLVLPSFALLYTLATTNRFPRHHDQSSSALLATAQDRSGPGTPADGGAAMTDTPHSAGSHRPGSGGGPGGIAATIAVVVLLIRRLTRGATPPPQAAEHPDGASRSGPRR